MEFRIRIKTWSKVSNNCHLVAAVTKITKPVVAVTDNFLVVVVTKNTQPVAFTQKPQRVADVTMIKNA